MHQKQHLEGCTSQDTSNGAQNTSPRRMHSKGHLEGCTKRSTSKDAHHKAPRRVHKTHHLEGCIQRVISKDARTKASRRMHTERKPEGCAIRSPGKGNHENTYTSRSNAKFTFERKKKRGYNESRLDQHKYSPAHRYPSVVHALQHGNIYKQILKPPKQTPTS